MFPAARWQAANFPHHRLHTALGKNHFYFLVLREHLSLAFNRLNQSEYRQTGMSWESGHSICKT
jgi:hypothetical protein